MNEEATKVREYRVGDQTTEVRFLPKEEVFRGIGDIGGKVFVFDTNTRPVVPGEFTTEIVLPPGEPQKSWHSVEAILRRARQGGIGRDGVFVGCGGGVICDITAFAASIYMRGCPVILVPTTLLAMVDAAFGGKTGIDFDGYKNLVGTFHPARELRVSVDFLSTLTDRDYRSGLAEVLKHAFLEQSVLLGLLEKGRREVLDRDLDLLATVVRQAIETKAGVVERDFREAGLRATLNLGHTFGHALESVTGFNRFTHGEAVAWGIDKAMRTGVLLGATDPAYARKVCSLLSGYGFSLGNLTGKAREIVSAMRQDKKKRGGNIRFVLQRGWGDTFLTEVDEALVLEVLSE